MMIKCPNCNALNLKKDGFDILCNGDRTQRYKCKQCDKRFTRGIQKFIVSSVINDVEIDETFVRCLAMYALKNNAKLVLLNTKQRVADKVDDITRLGLEEFILTDDLVFEKQSVKILGSLTLSTSLDDPLLGLSPISKGYSLIVGHPQVQLKTLPEVNGDYPPIITTTGTISERKYGKTKQGIKNNFNHSMSAVVLELDDSDFIIRHLNYDHKTESFYDLDYMYTTTEAIQTNEASALITGDEHVMCVDSDVLAVTYTNPDSISKILNPRFLVRHDLFDGHSISHHHENNNLLKYKKWFTGSNSVEAELDKTIDFIYKTTLKSQVNFIVQSNHNEHLQKWLNNCDPKKEPWNAKIFHKLMYMSLQEIEAGKIPDTFQLYVEDKVGDDIVFISRANDMKVHDISIASHGDAGINGSKGSRKQFSTLSTKTIIGHSHSPGIEKGCYQVGTSSILDADYAKGPSSWHHCHCVIYPNGKRQLLFIRNGKYRI